MAKITLITRNFPPVRGGIEKVVYEIYSRLSPSHQCGLVGPKGCKNYVNDRSKAIETPASSVSIFLGLSFIKSLIHILRHERPDIIIGGNGLMAPVVIILAFLFRAKSIVMVHGLDIIVESWPYQRLFAPFLRRADLIISCSENTAKLAIAKGVKPERIEIICPGVDLPEHLPTHEQAKQVFGLENKTLLLSVGRLIPRKGLAEFISHSFTELVTRDSNIELWIVGSEPESALNQNIGSVRDAIQTSIHANGLESRVKLLGQVDDAKLQQFYAAADVFVFPLVDIPGDVEGFGIVAVEAASHGTPTVAFDCGGVSDAIANGQNGCLVKPGDYALFSERITRLVSEPARDSSLEFAKNFSWENYSQKLNKCITNLTS